MTTAVVGAVWVGIVASLAVAILYGDEIAEWLDTRLSGYDLDTDDDSTGLDYLTARETFGPLRVNLMPEPDDDLPLSLHEQAVIDWCETQFKQHH